MTSSALSGTRCLIRGCSSVDVGVADPGDVQHQGLSTAGPAAGGSQVIPRRIVFVTHRRFPRTGGAIGQLVSALEELVAGRRLDAPEPGAVCFP